MYVKLYVKPTSLYDYYQGKSILGFTRFMDQNDVEFYIKVSDNVIIQQEGSFVIRKKKLKDRFKGNQVYLYRKGGK